ncbi:hypothetical protein ACKQC9_00385 [Klebsiella michiganensis]|uniref:hypothetical protein n=1 Tax=Klebsiella TaxID=570 RepID=UPI00141C1F83|nr:MULTISPECIES: hypothetical protein [Klebsiella]MBS6909416.1 hypothetical protein [Klebsiella sp.]MDM4109751.1 hypothetical protein [Klebsiella michiganensis]MDM4342459.1 hypothetical protein [Klebsiella michiganensis]MDM4348970.1 hypothetical protein [Klebsiella michiganensis]MEE1964953.1 hypothetical protein [Klebsiella michiganensis]
MLFFAIFIIAVLVAALYGQNKQITALRTELTELKRNEAELKEANATLEIMAKSAIRGQRVLRKIYEYLIDETTNKAVHNNSITGLDALGGVYEMLYEGQQYFSDDQADLDDEKWRPIELSCEHRKGEL